MIPPPRTIAFGIVYDHRLAGGEGPLALVEADACSSPRSGSKEQGTGLWFCRILAKPRRGLSPRFGSRRA